MSTRFCLISSCCLLTLLATAQTTNAQYGARIDRPLDRPVVSPYVNLFRNSNNGGGGAGVLNYYGLVRPQVNAQLANQQLGQNIQRLQAQQGYLRNQVGQQRGAYGYSQLGTTGHPTTFMSFSSGGAASIGGGFSGGASGIGGGGLGGSGFSGGAFSGAGNNLSPGGNLGGGPQSGFSGSQIGVGVPTPGAFGGGSLTGHSATFGTGGGNQSRGGF